MNSNILMFLIAIFILLLLSAAWYFFLSYYCKRNGDETNKRERILSMIKFDNRLNIDNVVCPAELPNTDEDVADALKYIEATNFAGELLERLYEQAGI